MRLSSIVDDTFDLEIRSVRHERELPIPARNRTNEELQQASKYIEKLKQEESFLDPKAPSLMPNTSTPALFLASFQRGLPKQPLKALRFSNLIFLSYWQENLDISSSVTLKRLALQLGVGNLLPKTIDESTIRVWQHEWAQGNFNNKTPVIVSPKNARLVGLASSRRLLSFLKSGVLNSEDEGVC